MQSETLLQQVAHLFRLDRDQAAAPEIDATIRGNVRMAGTNLWVLMCAIVIASVGLNVNSTAVIIGAMLVSPLMGPIIGIGYGAAIQDALLIRRALRNLGIFVGISLFTSTLYFLITPLTEAHSELLARTSPTIWDVLIAFFGGAAGMIGLTRKEKTTLLPGVAIATALMPPLCTVGYGLATGQPRFFLGAFFLFVINCVFIAFGTLLIAGVLRLPKHAFEDEAARRRGRVVIAGVVILTLLPSAYLAWQLVREEVFATSANRLVATVSGNRQDVALVAHDIAPDRRAITLTLIGQGVTPAYETALQQRLGEFGLHGATLTVRHPTDAQPAVDFRNIKRELQQEVLRNALVAIESKAARIAELEARVATLDATVAALSLPQVRQRVAQVR